MRSLFESPYATGMRVLGARGLLIIAALLFGTPEFAEGGGEPRFETERLELRDGSVVTARLRLPAQGPAKMPGVLVLAGFHQPMAGLEALLRDVPVVLASFEYPYEGERVFKSLAALRHLPRARRMVRQSLESIDLLSERLRRHPRVDPDRLVVIGVSLGSPFALQALHHFPERFRGAAIVHGFGDLVRTSAFHLKKALHPWLGPLAEWGALGLAQVSVSYLGVPSPEALASGLGARHSVIVIEAKSDRMVPASVRDSLWSALSRSQAQVERRVVGKAHVNVGSRKTIDLICETIEEWMGRNAGL